MFSKTSGVLSVSASITCLAATLLTTEAINFAAQTPPGAMQRIDLAAQLTAKKLRGAGREVTSLQGSQGGVKVSSGPGFGLVWIDGTNFALGTLEIDVRGKDALNASYLGVAFHRKDDNTYENIYLRPFNFRATDPLRHQHAIQYEAVPEHPWARLRELYPEEFEDPVDATVDPNGWVALRVVVTADRIQAFAGAGATPALEVRRLAQHNQGEVGLWVGNGSDGDFANLRITPGR